MASRNFFRLVSAASVAALLVFGAEGARAASPSAACPGEVSVGPTADMIPAPAGMPLNCTVAFYDGTVNFAGGATGHATDGYTSTTTIYDQQGRLVGVTNSLGETVILGPEKGVLSTVADPLGHTTTFTYDAAGSVAQVVSPPSSQTTYTYDSSERVITVTDPLGVVTTNAYDSQGRMMSSTPTVGAATTNTYDSMGRLAQQTAGSDTTMYQYDASNRLIEVTDSLGDTTTYTYDSMGRLASETVTPPSGGLTTTITYDAHGNVIEVSESSGPTTTYAYDAAGDIISVTDPEGDMTKFTYDSYGDVISMTDPSGGVTRFAYFAVPEPSTWVAMLLGFAGLVLAGRGAAKLDARISLIVKNRKNRSQLEKAGV
jgi:YD repeat-containing protein